MCPNSWINLQGSCYKFSSKALNWNAAKSACEVLRSSLVVINSQTKQQALTSKVSQQVWIGMHRDPKDKSRWLWVDGSRPTYTNWNTGEPNNLHEECGMMYNKAHGWKWNDRGCSSQFPYICETRGTVCLHVTFGRCHQQSSISARFSVNPLSPKLGIPFDE